MPVYYNVSSRLFPILQGCPSAFCYRPVDMPKFTVLFGVFFVVFFSTLSGQRAWDGAYLDFKADNDFFYLPDKTDQYFTSGLTLEVGREKKAPSPLFAAPLARRRQFLRLTQDLFTPRRIEAREFLKNDHPFASYLVLTYGTGYADEQLGFGFSQQFTAGVLGKYSGGGAMQNAYHDLLSFADRIPGWHYEVKPDLILNYRLGLRRGRRLGRVFWLSTDLVARLGSLYTDLAPALTAEWLALRVGPKRTVRFELSGQARLVGYNATLSGGLFNIDRRYRGLIIPERLVGRAGLDCFVDYDGWRVSGGIRRITPEFAGGRGHAWAWIGLRVQPGWRSAISTRNSLP